MKIQDLAELIREEAMQDKEYIELEKYVIMQLYRACFYSSLPTNVPKKDIPSFYNYKSKIKASFEGKNQLKLITVLHDLYNREIVGINCADEDFVNSSAPANPDIDLLYKRLFKIFYEDKDCFIFIKNKEYFHTVVVDDMAGNLAMLQTEFEKINRQKEEMERMRNGIITIVAVLVSVVPLLTVNLQILMNSFNLTKLFAVNGVLLMAIAFLFSLVDKITKERLHVYRSRYFWFGAVLFFLSLIMSLTVFILSWLVRIGAIQVWWLR